MFKRDVKPVNAVPEKTPMVSGGAAMMLKSLGVDPSQMEDLANAFLKDVSAMAARIEALEKSNSDLVAMNARQLELLEQIATQRVS